MIGKMGWENGGLGFGNSGNIVFLCSVVEDWAVLIGVASLVGSGGYMERGGLAR